MADPMRRMLVALLTLVIIGVGYLFLSAWQAQQASDRLNDDLLRNERIVEQMRRDLAEHDRRQCEIVNDIARQVRLRPPDC